MYSFHVYSLQSKKSKTQKGANTKQIIQKKYKNQNKITKKTPQINEISILQQSES